MSQDKDKDQNQSKPGKATKLDFFGLNITNFFLAELTGVILPFLSDFLKQQNWNYERIGLTVAMVGIGMFVFQIPAGILSDKISKRRVLLAVATIVSGACYTVLPHVVNQVLTTDILLLTAGAATAFFVPLLAALALSLAGHDKFDETFGTNQGFNHAGNITVSIASLICVKFFGVSSVFYIVGVLAILASVSLRLINTKHLNPDLSKERDAVSSHSRAKAMHHHSKGLWNALKEQFKTPSVRILIASVVLFNVANAPGMSTIGLYLKHLGSKDDFVAYAIIIGQLSMIPISYVAAKFCGSHGRKPVMTLAFFMLAARFALYPLTTNPNMVLAIQILNGFDAGIYGVAVALICGDLTEGKEGFNTLLGILQLAIAAGEVLGPITQGIITQYMGFPIAFFLLAAISAAGGVLFLLKMPETGKDADKQKTEKQAAH